MNENKRPFGLTGVQNTSQGLKNMTNVLDGAHKLRNLNVRQVQPKGGINLYNTYAPKKNTPLPKGADFFEKFFHQSSYPEPSFAKRINTVFEFHDAYTEQLFALQQAGTEPATGSLKDQAARNAQRALSQRGKNYAIPLEEYREVLKNSEFFSETRGFWDKVTESVDLFEVKNPSPSQRDSQNTFIQGVARELSSGISKGDIEAEYGQKALQRYRSPLSSQKGELTYFNLESKDIFKDKFMNDVFGREGKGLTLSQSMLNLDSYFNNVGGTFDEAMLTEIRSKISREINPFGSTTDNINIHRGFISPEYADNIVDMAFRAAQGDDANIVSVIPGKVLHSARSDGTLQNHRYANNLTSNNSKFFKNVVKQEESRAKRHVSAKPISKVFESFENSEQVASRFKTADKSLNEMNEHITRTRKMFGFKGDTKVDYIEKVDHMKKIQETANIFEKKGYNVSLDYSEDSENLLLSFSSRNSGVDLAGLDLTQKMSHEGIGQVTMPLENESFLTNIQGTNVHSKLFLDFDGELNLVNRDRNQIKLRRASSLAYDEIQNIPEFIERQKNAPSNKDISESIIFQEATANYKNKIMRRVTPGEHSGMDMGSGYVTSSVSKNFASSASVDIGDFIDSYYEQAFPESFARFDDYRKSAGNRKMRYVDAHDFIDSDWKNTSGQRDALGMRMNIISESMMRFNEMFGSEQLGLHLTSYGLNANQVRTGTLEIGDWRQFGRAGELNPATREQIVKTLNYAPLERDIMENYMMDFYGDQRGARYATPISRVGLEAIDTATQSENQMSEAFGRTMHLHDGDMAEAGKKVEKKFREEIAAIDAELNSTSNETQKLNLLSRKEKLESGIQKIPRGSLHEEQMIVRKSWADKALVREQFEKTLEKGYEIPNELVAELRERQPELFDANGKLKAGRHDIHLTHEDLDGIGLVDRRNRITVGTMNREYAEGRGYSMSEEVSRQSQLFYKDSTINSLIVDADGNTSFGMTQLQRLDDGTKTIEGSGGTRTTATVFDDFLYDAYEKELGGPGKTLFMREHIKEGRNPQGQLVNTLTNTSYFNALEDIDNILTQNADGSYSIDSSKSTVPGVRRWAENVGNIKGGREAYERDFLKNEFIPAINASGYEDMIVLGETGSSIKYNDTGVFSRALEGLSPDEYRERSKQRYDNLYDYATKDMGFDSRYAVTSTSIHDHPRYQGQKGANYADREARILSIITNRYLGEDSDLSAQIYRLRDTGSAAKHREFAEHVSQSLEVFNQAGQDIRQYQGGGNVVFDFTGKFQGEQSIVRRKAADGSSYYVVDGFSVPRPDATGSMKLGSEVLGTTEDLMSLEITGFSDIGKNYTVQDLIRDENSQAVIQLPHDSFSKNVLPVYNQFDEHYDQNSTLYQRRMNRGQNKVTNALFGLRDAVTEGGNVPRQRNLLEEGIEEMYVGGNTYLTGKGKSDFIKSQFRMENNRGISGVLGGYNTQGNFLKENEFAVSEEMALHLIEGNERNILQANNITRVGDVDLSKTSQEDMRAEIIGRITGASSEDDDFSLVSSYNRFPTQSQGSIQFGKVRIDESLKGTDRLMVSQYVAEKSGGDFDGDTAYLYADYYSEKAGKGTTDFASIQKDLLTMSDISKESIKDMSEIILPSETFSYARNASLSDDEIASMFSKFTGASDEALDLVAKATQIPGIGYVDNELVAGRGLVVDMFETLRSEGVFGEGDTARATMHEWIDKYDQGSNKLVQGYISAKKLTPDMLNVSDKSGEVLQLFEDMNLDEQTARLSEITGQRSMVPGSLSRMNTNNIDEIIGSWMSASAIDASEVDSFKGYMLPLAIANEVNTNKGGSRNASFKLGRSDGTDALALIRGIEENPASLHATEEVIALGNMFYGSDSDVMSNFKSIQEAESGQIATRYERIVGRLSQRESSTSTTAISSSIIESLDFAEGLQDMNRTGSKVYSQNQAFNQAKSFISTTANSSAFQLGAGAAAMWMISSALRDGPTPEGNEAQQEASAEEVNPTALLTSPTARVTPNTENINLSISGVGNVSETALAGMVNNQVNGMIGSQMDMNINITDNTRRLDRSFYEQQVNSVLGL